MSSVCVGVGAAADRVRSEIGSRTRSSMSVNTWSHPLTWPIAARDSPPTSEMECPKAQNIQKNPISYGLWTQNP